MRHSPHISTPWRPGAGALSALVLLSLLMVSVDRLEASRGGPGGGVAVAAAAGARGAGVGIRGGRAEAPVRPVRSLAGFRVDRAELASPAPVPAAAADRGAGQGAQGGVGVLARSGLLDLPPPGAALA